MRCTCQVSLDGLFLDRHEGHCATRTGLTPEQQARAEDRYTPDAVCGRITRSPLNRIAVLHCGVTGHHTTHVSRSLTTGSPVWEWEDGTPARPYGQKREAA